MSLLGLVRLVLAVLALRGVRWAYGGFVVLGLLYFPAKVGFRLEPRPCRLAIDGPLALQSLTNFGHIVLFGLFFVMSCAQLRMSGLKAFAWAGLATILMGALVEAAQGLTGEGNCRVRDLIPDTLGVVLGSTAVVILRRMGWKPRPTWALAWWR